MTQQQKEAGLKAFHYDLVIHAEDAAQADRVMVERVNYDEDLSEYGVGNYTIDADPAGGRELAPVEVDEKEAGAGEEASLAAAISTEGEATSVNAEQYFTILRINRALNGGYRLPAARLVSVGTDQTALELIYNSNTQLYSTDVRVRLDDDGALHSMDMLTGGTWIEAEGGTLHQLVVDALAAAPSES